MSEQPVRFGLIGFGMWGRHHAASIAKSPGADLVAIAEKSEGGQAEARAVHPNVEVVAEYHRLLERDDIDVIDLVVPNHLHHEVGKQAIQCAKHLLIEKPMALTAEHCDELVALARSQGKVLAVNHEMRLSRLWGQVKALVDEGRIGKPLHVLIELSRFPYRLGSEGWRFDIKRVGNWILEEPIHFFDLARWYLSSLGEAQSVYARANSRQEEHPELRDNFSAIVNFPGEGYAVVTQTLAAFEHHVTCKLTGTQGAIWANWSAPDARSPTPTFGLRYSMGDKIEEVSFESATGEVVELEDQIDAVVRSVREGVPPPVTGEDGRWSVMLCLAAQRSVDIGQLVSLPI
jgi:myo-inositol 2-dehydrogenase/D-chiro-inositol 1-dehydrogenase